MNITVICHESMCESAGHFAMVFGESPADAASYSSLGHQGVNGGLYSVAGFVARYAFTIAARAPLHRPEWDVEGVIDMQAAQAAQLAMVFWNPQSSALIPQAASGKIVCLWGIDHKVATAMAGVERIKETDDF